MLNFLKDMYFMLSHFLSASILLVLDSNLLSTFELDTDAVKTKHIDVIEHVEKFAAVAAGCGVCLLKWKQLPSKR